MIDLNKNPLVSVIIPSYNHEDFVEKSIMSVLEQDYGNIEIIVIDDGSNDNSRTVIKELLRKYDFIYIEQKNQGVSRTLNNGISKARGAYLSFLASDDFIYHNKISLLMEKFSEFNSNTAMIFGDADIVDKDGNIFFRKYKNRISSSTIDLYIDKRKKEQILKNKYVEYEMLIEGNFIPAMSVLCNAEKIKEIGLFPEDNVMEDYPLWLELTKKYKIGFVNCSVAAYRQHNNNTIIKNRQKIVLNQIKILNNEFAYAIKKANIFKLLLRYFKLHVSYFRGRLS